MPLYFIPYEEDYVVVMLWGVMTRTGIQYCITAFILIIFHMILYFIPLIYLSSIAYGKYPKDSCFVTLEMAIMNFLPFSWVVTAFIICYIGSDFTHALQSPHVMMSFSLLILSTYVNWTGRNTEIRKYTEHSVEVLNVSKKNHKKLSKTLNKKMKSKFDQSDIIEENIEIIDV